MVNLPKIDRRDRGSQVDREIIQRHESGLDRGAINYITDEDYFQLKETLDKRKHIALGILRASRARAKKLKGIDGRGCGFCAGTAKTQRNIFLAGATGCWKRRLTLTS